MPKSRANGEGSVYQLADGTWRVSAMLLRCFSF